MPLRVGQTVGVIRVAVFGACGRMGATTCEAVAAAPDLDLVAMVDPGGEGTVPHLTGGDDRDGRGKAAGEGAGPPTDPLVVAGDAGALQAARADVAVDFTVAPAARQNLEWCAEHAVHAVCGTTGLGAGDIDELTALFGSSRANAVIAPNFSIGAALMMRCAELCAPYLEGAEIIELHHDQKRDAPSGTALATAARIEAARAAAGGPPEPPDRTERFVLAGARGALTEGGLHIHSVRLPGLVAHQEVILGSTGETLTIRHDSIDRVSFMPGVLLAIRRVGMLDGLTVGLAPLLGL